MSCTQDVDDPANFDSGTPPADTSASGGDTANEDTQGASESGAGGMTNGGDSSTGEPIPPGDSGSSGDPVTGGPVDDSGGPAGCGDGMVSPGEQCDGVNLQGFDCSSLGLGSGTLACDPMTCTFDTSMCMGGGGGTGGPE